MVCVCVDAFPHFHIQYANQIIISKNKIDLMVDSVFNGVTKIEDDLIFGGHVTDG